MEEGGGGGVGRDVCLLAKQSDGGRGRGKAEAVGVGVGRRDLVWGHITCSDN